MSVPRVLDRPWGRMHWRADGPEGGPAVVFANSLGTDLRVWDPLLAHLPPGLRVIRFDKRGHGLSDPGGDASIADLADDAAALIEAAARGPVVLVGLSIGGLIGQALAATRPDLLAALVLSNTAARIGTPALWADRIGTVEAQGLEALADGVMERWFSPAFRATPALAPWRNMLVRTSVQGYVATVRAIAAADLTAQAASLRLPVLAIAGSLDGSTPAALVDATAALIPGARYALMEGVGHIPNVEAPAAYAALLTPFLQKHLGD